MFGRLHSRRRHVAAFPGRIGRSGSREPPGGIVVFLGSLGIASLGHGGASNCNHLVPSWQCQQVRGIRGGGPSNVRAKGAACAFGQLRIRSTVTARR